MKKYLAMMLCAGLLFTATGCGNEKKEESSGSKTDAPAKEQNQILSCVADSSYMKANTTFTYDKDGKEMQSMKTVLEMTFEDDQLEDVKDEDINEFCDEFKSDESVKSCNAKLNGNKLIADVDFDVKKLEDEADSTFSKDTPIDQLKERLEEDELTCEIKK